MEFSFHRTRMQYVDYKSNLLVFRRDAMEMGCAKSVWWTSTDCRQCCKMDSTMRQRFGVLECLTIRKNQQSSENLDTMSSAV